MWNPFKRKPESFKMPEILFFKSNQAAFEYCSEYMTCPLAKGSRVYGLVKQIIPSKPSTKYVVKLAAKADVVFDNGWEMFTKIANQVGVQVKPIQVGDLVMLDIESYYPEL